MRHKVRSNIIDSNGPGGDECKNNGTVIAPEAATRDNKKHISLDVKHQYSTLSSKFWNQLCYCRSTIGLQIPCTLINLCSLKHLHSQRIALLL